MIVGLSDNFVVGRKSLSAFIVEFPERRGQRETHVAESEQSLDAWINEREGNQGDHVITLVRTEEQLAELQEVVNG